MWFSEATPFKGEFRGHNASGEAIVRNHFNNDMTMRLDEVRLEDPFERSLPNWFSLPQGGLLLQPSTELRTTLSTALAQRIPPGPSYMELIREIWGRGFEVFLVGGTVRDALAGKKPNDIDIVTTMPLIKIKSFLKSMYRSTPGGNDRRGFIRIGGGKGNRDPFIDVKVFSDSLPGSKFAKFGVGFDQDMKHRDFACNALYFDPINEVLIDPSGRGVSDCKNHLLDIICDTNDSFQKGQIFIRAVKFMTRGFKLTDDSREKLINAYFPCVSGMRDELRIQYLLTQMTSKLHSHVEKIEAIGSFKIHLSNLGLDACWEQQFAIAEEELTPNA